MRVCYTRGGAATQAREAARLRLASLMDQALKVCEDILKDVNHPDAFRVAKDILDRNKLLGTGTPEDAMSGHSLTVSTQVNTNVSEMSNVDLERYEKLLRELREVLPDAPKAIEGIVAR